jgi:hypothetical protein
MAYQAEPLCSKDMVGYMRIGYAELVIGFPLNSMGFYCYESLSIYHRGMSFSIIEAHTLHLYCFLSLSFFTQGLPVLSPSANLQPSPDAIGAQGAQGAR